MDMKMTRYVRALLLLAAMPMSCSKDSGIFVTPSGNTEDVMVEIRASDGDGQYPWWSYNRDVTVVTDARDMFFGKVSMADGASASVAAVIDEAATTVWAFRGGQAETPFSGTVSFSVPSEQAKTGSGSAAADIAGNMCFCSSAGKFEPGQKSVSLDMVPVTAGIAFRIYDSGHSAEGESIRSITFKADGGVPVAGTATFGLTSGSGGSMTGGTDFLSLEISCEMTVMHGDGCPSEAGMAIFPVMGLTGKAEITTDRGTYEFILGSPADISAGELHTIDLDMSQADSSPKRKVGILGDSISTFRGYINAGYGAYYPAGDVTSVKDTWWYKLIYGFMPNATLDVNSSYAGTRVTTDPKYPGYDFVSRCLDFEDPDIIVIHGGTNDSNNGVVLGSYDWDADAESLNPDHFRTAYIRLIKTLKMHYGDIRIICIVGDRLNSGYADSIVEIASHFGIPCVNFQNDGDNIPKVSGSHPTSAGFDWMADKIWSQAKDYLK